MMTRDQLQFLLEKLHPMLRHGIDYWCGHEVDPAKPSVQTAPAKIHGWKPKMPTEPTQAVIDGLWKVYGDEFTNKRQATDVRAQRNTLLSQADVLIHTAEDAGKSDYAIALRKYRQALRAVPEQPGFPTTIDWPVQPTEKA